MLEGGLWCICVDKVGGWLLISGQWPKMASFCCFRCWVSNSPQIVTLRHSEDAASTVCRLCKNLVGLHGHSFLSSKILGEVVVRHLCIVVCVPGRKGQVCETLQIKD